jgi:uncharacterized protein
LKLANVVALLALAASFDAARGQQAPQIPPPRGMVNDFANVIPAAQAARIESIAEYVRARSKGEIVVVTLSDLGGRDASEMALRIGREWKVGSNASIGEAARNTGIIILVVPKETSRDGKGYVKIEVGQGTEGFLTDGQAGDIWREAIPLLQARDYGGAIEQMTERVAQRYAANFGFSLDSFAAAPEQRAARVPRQRGNGGPSIVNIGFIVFVVLLLILGGGRGRGSGCLWLALMSQGGGRSGGGWGGGGGFGGGGGGGFGGFGGGGGFSGGGSGGSW